MGGGGITLLKRIPNTDYYYLYNEMAEFGTFPTSPYYLHSEKAKGRDLKYSLQSQTGGRDRWEIIPIEDFELTDISYAFVAGDKINLNPQLIRTENLVNNTNSSVSKKWWLMKQ